MSADQWAATRPDLTHENEVVLKVWKFCDGWNPERIPLAVAYYDVQDIDMLLGQLMAINDAVSAYQAAQK